MEQKTYALTTFQIEGKAPEAGLAIGEKVASLSNLVAAVGGDQKLAESTVLELLENWEKADKALVDLRSRVSFEDQGQLFHDFSDVHILPPVNLPRQVFCTGANYRKHVVDMMVDMNVGPEGLDAEGIRDWAANMMDERARSGEPYTFTKPISTIAGAYDPLPLPDYSEQPDWEIEIAVVIGRGGFQISRDSAHQHIAGYAVVNDVTSRDLIARKDYKQLGTDWFRAKGQPGYLPFGPVMVPARFVEDPYALKLNLSVNGEVMQNESASDMIFNIARQIEYISAYAKLMPGDVICTGSPAGNGTHHGRFLKPDDLMIGSVTGLGEQRIPCVARE